LKARQKERERQREREKEREREGEREREREIWIKQIGERDRDEKLGHCSAQVPTRG
jgi:hypothetical protein